MTHALLPPLAHERFRLLLIGRCGALLPRAAARRRNRHG